MQHLAMLPFRPADQSRGGKSNDESHPHNATVAAITSHCEKVLRVHSDDGSFKLRYQPPRGWPQITLKSFIGLGKADGGIELVRHIPYFNFASEISIMGETYPQEFISPGLLKAIHRSTDNEASSSLPKQKEYGNSLEKEDDKEEEEELPPNMICLAYGKEYGDAMYIDVKPNNIILSMNGDN